ncbi:MAG: hypothetical protein JWL77_863 [Chthonomonadaceae bacterium]|nr:hypothetical protein [Chthonomonadaceae bacterium]
MREKDGASVEQTEEIAVLAAQLRSHSARERVRARRVLQRRGIAVLPAMQALLRDENLKKRKARPLRAACGAAIFVLFVLFQCYLATPVAWGLIPVLGLLAAVLARMCAVTPAQVEAVRVLAGLDDVHTVGPLLEALEWRDLAEFSGVRAIATQALYRLLPRLQPEHADLLDDHQLACLYRLLRHHPSDDQTELIVALLGAVAQIGDARAVAQLERMTRDSGGPLPRERVRRTAQETLTQLRQRLDRAPGSLLRAASDIAAPNLLLRPAVAAPATDPQQLLRASQTDKDI